MPVKGSASPATYPGVWPTSDDRLMKLASCNLPRLTIAAVATCALVLASCGEDDPATRISAGDDAALDGTQWVLDVARNGGERGEAVSSWIKFEGGRVSGSDGCNRFSGSYEASDGALTLGPLAGTQIACDGAAGRVAASVTEGFGIVDGYAISGEKLRLTAGGAEVLSYDAQPAGVEGSWTATSVLYGDAIHGIVTGTKLTAVFAADGTVSGSGGCNMFNGPYTFDGGPLDVGPLAATRKACKSPPRAGEQERGYLAALESVVRAEQAGDALTLFNSQDQMAVIFKRR